MLIIKQEFINFIIVMHVKKKKPRTSHTQTPETDRDPDHEDFVNKENRGARIKT